MRRVFLTGGSGLVGGAVLERLARHGDQVVALARSEAAEGVVRRRGASPLHGDLFEAEILARGMEGCETVFHVAGINRLCAGDPAPMLRVNVEGTAATVRAAARAGVRRLVYTSSAATIGERRGTVGIEGSPHRGTYLSSYERSKREGEQAALAIGRETGLEVVCVNPSSVQGPGRVGGTGRILLAFLDGRLRVFVKTNISLVDIDDCAAGHLLAGERGAPGERYLLNGATLTISEAFALASEVAGVERRPRLVPRAAAIAGAAAVEGVFRLRGRQPPVCREMVRTLLHGHRYDGSRAERELGMSYTDPRETMRRTVEWAREEGLLRDA